MEVQKCMVWKFTRNVSDGVWLDRGCEFKCLSDSVNPWRFGVIYLKTARALFHDDLQDCDDGSDELEQDALVKQCDPMCDSRNAQRLSVCDGKQDCAQYEDELDCGYHCPPGLICIAGPLQFTDTRTQFSSKTYHLLIPVPVIWVEDHRACWAVGLFATFSSITSAVFVALFTVGRFLAVKYHFGEIRFTILTILFTWLMGVTLASLPVLPFGRDWVIFSTRGMCLGLPLNSERLPGW
ncbi:hypothetical protein EGW08_007633 [Elysia chlorotica]|uniref:Uncharacterized protein n=1 Tax=Elysia chlorotica TaxID=188477 RepID=A0A433TSX7_ELYCH|nr:hypothetical protein EGW08_007633 [Elysia chlorotica]